MSFFKKLFGKQKDDKVILSTSESIQKIHETENLLVKKQEHLEDKIAEEQEIAKENASKNKRIALQALKRKKRYEAQLDQVLSTMITLETQRTTLENSELNANVMDTMSVVAKALKKANKELNIEDVNATMDEINEAHDLVNEVTEAINGITLTVEDDEFEEELKDLAQEALDEEMIKITPTPIKLPDVPYTEMPTSAKKEEKDDELKELEEWVN